jgi:hypothetical protein
VLGRFLSADPFVGDAGDSQEYNRYSYLGNNPLGGTDPSGYFSLKDAVKIVAIVAIAYVTGGWGAEVLGPLLEGALFGAKVAAGIGGGLTGGFASGFAGSLLNGGSIGEAFKAGAIGGLAGAVTGGFLGRFSGMELNAVERGLAHGSVHGASAESTGGEFRHGFFAGFLNGSLDGRIGTAFQDSESLQYAAAAVVGGTGSVIGGGKFANGAVSGAFSYMFNNQGGQVMQSLLKARSGLRLLGNIPFIGEAADLASAGISIAAGDYVGAGLDLASAIPGVGNVVGGARLAKEGAGLAVDAASAYKKSGRAGKQTKLKSLLSDPNVSAADKGWIKQDMNAIEHGSRSTIRVPPGKNLAHRRGYEAKNGHGYEHSDLQDIDLHKLQHKHEGY